MAASSLVPRLTDILEAIGRIRSERWLVEGGVEIISGSQPSSQRRTESQAPGDSMVEGGGDRKCSSPRIRGRCAAGDVELAQEDLNLLEQVCREELAKEQITER
jgi:hypothetical protein